MKFLVFFFLIGFLAQTLSAQCPTGNLILKTQAEVDAFFHNYPNCTEIEGNLVIGFIDQSQETDINSLNDLNNLTLINGDILIHSNPILNDLNGLENINKVDGKISIDKNLILYDISALENIDPFSINNKDPELPAISIQYNPLLNECSLQNFCDLLKIANKDIEVNDNGTNCNSIQSLSGNCAYEYFNDQCIQVSDEYQLIPKTDNTFTNIEYECKLGSLQDMNAEITMPANGVSCDFTGSPTVWYEVKVDDYAAQLFTTVTTQGSWEPMWSVFYGPDCQNLLNAAAGNTPPCSLNDNTPYIHQTEVKELYNTYFVAVSANPEGPPVDDPFFSICAATIINVVVCLGDINDNCEPDPSTMIKITQREYPEYEPDFEPEQGYMGPFLPGEQVQVHIEFFYDATYTGGDWFKGIVPNFGNGWDFEGYDFEEFPPFATGENGGFATWHQEGTECEATMEEPVPHLCTYRDENGVLRLCNSLCENCYDCPSSGLDFGDVLPSGYFWNGDGSNSGCVQGSCRPGEQWGVGAVTSELTWDFPLKVKEFEDYQDQFKMQDLQITFQTFSDGGAGCWEDPVGECLIDRKQIGPKWQVGCPNLPNVIISSTSIEILSGEPVDISLETENQSEFKIIVEVSDNPFISGGTFHEFNNGAGLIQDILILDPDVDSPQTLFYFIHVVDPSNNCAGIAKRIEVLVLPDQCNLTLNTNLSNESCEGECDGMIAINEVINGTEPIEYSWSDGSNTPVINDLCANEYIVTITDAEECMLIESIIIGLENEIVIAEISVSDITDDHAGSIMVTMNNTGNYSFSWTGPNNFSSQNQSIFDLVDAGCYDLLITDSQSGCTKLTTICIQDLSSKIIYMEYFWDDIQIPYGSGFPVPIDQHNEVEKVINVSIEDLDPGVHSLFFRVRDQNNQWSMHSHNSIMILDGKSGSNIIDSLEFFWDDLAMEPGTGFPYATNLVEVLNDTLSFDQTSIPVGVHNLYARVHNDYDQWSTPFLVNVFVNSYIHGPNEINKIEYFFNEEPGFAGGQLVAIDPTNDFNDTVKIAVEEGFHGLQSLFFRIQNAAGQWSFNHILSLFVEYDIPERAIEEIEVFFNADPGFGNGIPYSFPDDTWFGNFEFELLIPMLLPIGENSIFIRPKDYSGVWGPLVEHPIDITLFVSTEKGDDLNQIKEVIAYPNPFNDHLNIDFYLEKASFVHIMIVANNGMVNRSKSFDWCQSGNNHIDLNLNDLPAGNYQVILNSAGFSKVITLNKTN